jgi:hypothetical protein
MAGFLDFILSGVPSWLGGTQTWPSSGGSAAATTATPANATNYMDVASAMNPALSGQAAIANTAPAATATGLASSVGGSDWASALGGAGGAGAGMAGALGALSKLSSSGSQSQAKAQQTPLPQQASSAGFHQGTQPTALAEMLANQGNRAAWFLQNLNPNQSGLLGRQ